MKYLVILVWYDYNSITEIHWRGEWQTTSVFLPWEPHEQYEKAEKKKKKKETSDLQNSKYLTPVSILCINKGESGQS